MADELEVLAPDAGNPAPQAQDPGPAQGQPVDGTPAQEPGKDPDAKVEPQWREDWRQLLANGDEKALKRLERFHSPQDVWASYRSLEGKIGKVTPDKPEDPAKLAEWRKSVGLPDSPDGYLDGLPDGLVIGEADKPLMSSFAEQMHGLDAKPEVVKAAVDWYYKQQEQVAAAQVEADRKMQREAADVLRAEWGAEYTPTLNSMKAFFEAAPEMSDGTPLADAIFDARLPNGQRFGDNPDVLRYFARVVHEANPAGFVAPGAGLSQTDAMQSELATINKLMVDNPKAYYGDEKIQARWRQLTDAMDKLQRR